MVGVITDVHTFSHLCQPPPSCCPLPPSLRPSPHRCLCPWVTNICSLANPFTFFHPVTFPSPLIFINAYSVPQGIHKGTGKDLERKSDAVSFQFPNGNVNTLQRKESLESMRVEISNLQEKQIHKNHE